MGQPIAEAILLGERDGFFSAVRAFKALHCSLPVTLNAIKNLASIINVLIAALLKRPSPLMWASSNLSV